MAMHFASTANDLIASKSMITYLLIKKNDKLHKKVGTKQGYNVPTVKLTIYHFISPAKEVVYFYLTRYITNARKEKH